jgi:hypothetical protein
MSRMFNGLKAKYDRNFISKDTLMLWVEANQRRSTVGITPEEYAAIIGEVYAVDATNAVE